jgi:hypothetical protein
MTYREREALAERTCNFYHDSSEDSVRTNVNYSVKQKFSMKTVYNILKKYIKYRIKKDRLCNGQLVKLSAKKLTHAR